MANGATEPEATAKVKPLAEPPLAMKAGDVKVTPTTPVGKVGGVIASPASTLMEIVPDRTTLPCESVTFAAKLKVLGTADAEIVPLILPVLLRLKPPGRLPELTTKVKGPRPPVSKSAFVGYSAPASPSVKAPVVEIASCALIVTLKLAEAVCFVVAESVTVAVKV